MLLMFFFYYDVLFMFILIIGVEYYNVVLIDCLYGCFNNFIVFGRIKLICDLILDNFCFEEKFGIKI